MTVIRQIVIQEGSIKTNGLAPVEVIGWLKLCLEIKTQELVNEVLSAEKAKRKLKRQTGGRDD